MRFVERVGESDECEGLEAARVACHGGKSPPAKRRFSGTGSTSEALNKSQPVKTAPSPSKFVPRSLSLVEMLKLGKVITQSTTSVDLYSFDLQQMSWSKMPSSIDFSIHKRNHLLQEVSVKRTKQQARQKNLKPIPGSSKSIWPHQSVTLRRQVKQWNNILKKLYKCITLRGTSQHD